MHNEKEKVVRGVLAFPEGTSRSQILKTIIPKKFKMEKSAHFEKGIQWLTFYKYYIRTCDLCGKPACSKGLIRYMNNDRSKTLVYLCPNCAKKVPELKNKARKYCKGCNGPCEIKERKYIKISSPVLELDYANRG